MDTPAASPSPLPVAMQRRAVSPAAVDQYIPAFDWLRAALAVTVMLYHDSVITWHHAGSLAVQIFFALSGWLIGGILLHTSAADLPRFYFNRAVRIWAPYYVALFLLVAASLLKDHTGEKWTEFVIYKLLMVWNLFGSPQLAEFVSQMPLQGSGNHFWSVNAEEQFYLVSPVLLVLAPRWGRSMLLWTAITFFALATKNAYASIVMGVLGAVAASRFGPLHLVPRARIAIFGVFALCAVAVASGSTLEISVPVLGLAAVLLLASPGRASRIGKIAGGMSYPLYLNHWIGVFVGNAMLAPYGLRDSVLRHVLAALFNIAFAVCLYVYLDRKLLVLRAHWYTETVGRMTRILAYLMILLGVGFAALHSA